MFSFPPLMTPFAPGHKFLGAQSEVNRIKECRRHAPAGVTLEQAGITSRRRFLVVIVERGLVTGTGTKVIKGPGYFVAFPVQPSATKVLLAVRSQSSCTHFLCRRR